jgi:hypothetical protein
MNVKYYHKPQYDEGEHPSWTVARIRACDGAVVKTGGILYEESHEDAHEQIKAYSDSLNSKVLTFALEAKGSGLSAEEIAEEWLIWEREWNI